MQFIQKNKTISLIILAVLVLGVGWGVFSRYDEPQDVFQASIIPTANEEIDLTPEAPKQLVAFVSSEAPLGKAELVINNGATEQNFELEVSSTSVTAFDLLKQAEEISGLKVETVDYGDMGLLVEAIGGKKNGQDGKNWIYYINNELANVAVDKQVIKVGDKIEFKFESSPF